MISELEQLQTQTETVEKNTAISQAFGFRDKVGYMFGAIGTSFILGLVNSFVIIYYTNVLGISGAVVGTLFLVAKIIDAFSDVTVGRLTDLTTLTPIGRFLPWIKWSKYPFCAIIIFMFAPFVSNFSMPTKIIYVFVTYLIFGICLSASNVPYGSLASAVSQNPTHRVSLSTYRSVGAAISGASTGFIIPIVMYSTINGKRSISGSHFFFIAIVCATLAFIAFLLVVHFSVERVRVEQKETLPALVLLKGLAKNRALIVLLIVDLFIVVNQSIAGTTTTYLFNDYFKNKQAMSVALLFTYGTVIVLAPFAAKLTARFGKKESSIVALVAAALLYICMYLLHITNPWVYLALLFVATLGAGMFNIMIWAFYTDVIDYQQYKTGLREDGTVYGVNSFGRKVAQALSGAISGFMLTLIGYQSSTTGGAVQSVVVQQKIYTFANLLPVVCLLGAAIILFFGYPLNKKNTLAMQADLERRL